MKLMRPLPAPCKDCQEIPTLTTVNDGEFFQIGCAKCEAFTAPDRSVIAIAMLWNLANTGAVDINIAPLN